MPNCIFCDSPSVNVGETHCSAHLDALRSAHNALRDARAALLRATYRYYSPELDLGDTEGGPRFENTVVDENYANTRVEYLAAVSFETCDQDGGTLDCGGFEDATRAIQDAILNSIGALNNENT
jgi:hypothetical protein